ncbi:MAG: FAD-binding oxidoreductase [Spongiibacteraceae bacterium]
MTSLSQHNLSLPHCNSYYAASLNQQLGFSSLEGELRADVCVVGAGFTGISTALTLAERGYSVVVLEQHRVGWGASGRNGGQLLGGISGDAKLLKAAGPSYEEMILTMGFRGHEIIEQRVQKYGIKCDLKHGSMEVAFKARQLRELEDYLEMLAKYGLADQSKMVTAADMPTVLATEAYIGGMINNRNGHLHPLNLCVGEAKAAADLGVKIFESTEVLDIQHGDKPVVITASGRVIADSVVLAGNAYLKLEQKKLGGLIFPAGSYLIATEPLTEAEAQALNPKDMAVCDVNTVLDYYRLSADRRMIFGGRCNYSGRAPRSIRATMEPRMLEIFPQLRGKSIDFEWGGDIGIVVNRVPMLGRVDKNIFYAMGYCGHGINVSHLAGEIMADAVAGTFERMDVFEKVRHIPLPLGRQFGSQMLALGMLYYRLKDVLT